jgi:hypothetical protein
MMEVEEGLVVVAVEWKEERHLLMIKKHYLRNIGILIPEAGGCSEEGRLKRGSGSRAIEACSVCGASEGPTKLAMKLAIQWRLTHHNMQNGMVLEVEIGGGGGGESDEGTSN